MTDTIDKHAEWLEANGIDLPMRHVKREDGTIAFVPHTAASMWCEYRRFVSEHQDFTDATRDLVAEYGGPKQWRAFIALRDVLAQVDGE